MVLGALLLIAMAPHAIIERRSFGSQQVTLTLEQRLTAENNLRSTVIQLTAGLAVAVTAFLGFRQLTVTSNQIALQQRQLDFQQRLQADQANDQKADRLSATETQLASSSIDVRVAAIFALGYEVNDVSRTRVRNVLASYIRFHAHTKVCSERVINIREYTRLGDLSVRAPDIDAAILVLKGLGPSTKFLNLMDTNLSNSFMNDANLDSARLGGAQFGFSDFDHAVMPNATFADISGQNCAAHLEEAFFIGTDMTGVDFSNAVASGAHFLGACLAGADLSKANIRGADFSGSHRDSKTKFPSNFVVDPKVIDDAPCP